MAQTPYQSPYQPPRTPLAQPGPYRKNVAPVVWMWYVIYCVLMALLYVLCFGLGALFLSLDPATLEATDEDAMVLKIQGGMFMVISIPLVILYGAAPFLPKRKWAWIYGFVTIGIGLTSACCLPASIPLLIFWLKPETKAFFNVPG